MPKHTKRRGRSLNRNNRFRQTRRNNTRAKSLPPNQNVKSEEIGSGGFGIVSRPPARCGSFVSKNINEDAFREVYAGNPNYISKLTESSSAQKELDIALSIKERIDNYYNYYCLIEFICNAPEKKSIEINGDYYGTYAISPYCGITLKNYLRTATQLPLDKFELYHTLPLLQNLVYGVLLLHENNIVHQDIHDENILYDSEYNIMRLIDFGLAIDFNRNYNNKLRTNNNPLNKNDPKFISAKLHDIHQVVDDIIIPYFELILDYRNNIPINNAKLFRNYPELEDFLSNIRELNGKYDLFKNPRGKTSYVKVDKNEQLTRLMNYVYSFIDLPSLGLLANYIAKEKEEFLKAASKNNNH
jgi:serine/threonine protein kinase